MVNTNPITTVKYKTVNGVRFAQTKTVTDPKTGKSKESKVNKTTTQEYLEKEEQKRIEQEQTITKEVITPVQTTPPQQPNQPLQFLRQLNQPLPTSSQYSEPPNFLLRNREQQPPQTSQTATISGKTFKESQEEQKNMLKDVPANISNKSFFTFQKEQEDIIKVENLQTIGGKDVLQAKNEFEQAQRRNQVNSLSKGQDRKISSKILYPFLNPYVNQEGFVYGAVAPVIDVTSDVIKGITYSQPIYKITGFVQDVYKASTTDKTFKELRSERTTKELQPIITTGVVLGTTALTVFGGPIGTAVAGGLGTTFAGISAKQKISELQRPTANQGELLGGLATEIVGGVSSGLYTIKGVAQIGYNVKTRLTSPYVEPEKVFSPESFAKSGPKLSKVKDINEYKSLIEASTTKQRTVEPYTRYDIKIGQPQDSNFLIKTSDYFAQSTEVSGYKTKPVTWLSSSRVSISDPNLATSGPKGALGFETPGINTVPKASGAMAKFLRLPGTSAEGGYKFELFPTIEPITPQVWEIGVTEVVTTPKVIRDQPGFIAETKFLNEVVAPKGGAITGKRYLVGIGEQQRQLMSVGVNTVDPWKGTPLKANQLFWEKGTSEPEVIISFESVFKDAGKLKHTEFGGYPVQVKQFKTVQYDPLKGPTLEQVKETQQVLKQIKTMNLKNSEYASRPTSISTPIITPTFSNVKSSSSSIGTNRIVNFNTGLSNIGQSNSKAIIFLPPEPYRKDFQNKSGSFFGGDTTSPTSSFDRISLPSNFITPILSYTKTPNSDLRPTRSITRGSSDGGGGRGGGSIPPPPKIEEFYPTDGGGGRGGDSKPIPPPPEITSYTFEQDKFKSKLKKEKGLFDVYVRKKGKFVKAGEGFDLQTAIRKGKEIVGTTASASFKVVERKSQRVVNLQGMGLSNDRFYTSRKESGVLIEKSSKRIKSLGELREITFKGIQTQRRTRF
jgi:hypothetical protein